MKHKRNLLTITMLLFVLWITGSVSLWQDNLAYAQGGSSGFPFQGQLEYNVQLVNDSCVFDFTLYDTPSGGTPISTLPSIPADVNNGVFNVTLGFTPSDFATNDERWLGVKVRCPTINDNTQTELGQRLPVTKVPSAEYAVRSTWDGLTNIANGVGNGLQANGNQFEVIFDGDGVANSAARSDHNHAGEIWTTSDQGIKVETGLEGGVGIWGNGTLLGKYNVGVRGTTSSSLPDTGERTYPTGVEGRAFAETDLSVGVAGFSYSPGGIGVYGRNFKENGYAAYFLGNVHVSGNLSKSSGQFQIDHPLDPANKYLNHSFVESPDMMNIYNGNVLLDTNGEAWVQMPNWFEALNMEFRYQLTPIGTPGPNLYIAEEIQNNRFKIAGGASGMKVSWQVTGIRHDPYANAHRIQVEEDKAPADRGRYLHPLEHGQVQASGLPEAPIGARE